MDRLDSPADTPLWASTGTATTALPLRYGWSKEVADAFIESVFETIERAERAVRHMLKNKRSPNEAWQDKVHSITLILPVEYGVRLNRKIWAYTKVRFDESKKWIEDEIDVMRVCFSSVYRSAIIMPLINISKAQQKTRFRHAEKYNKSIYERRKQVDPTVRITKSIPLGRQVITGVIVKKWLTSATHLYPSSLPSVVINVGPNLRIIGSLPTKLIDAQVGDCITIRATVQLNDKGYTVYKRPSAIGPKPQK